VEELKMKKVTKTPDKKPIPEARRCMDNRQLDRVAREPGEKALKAAIERRLKQFQQKIKNADKEAIQEFYNETNLNLDAEKLVLILRPAIEKYKLGVFPVLGKKVCKVDSFEFEQAVRWFRKLSTANCSLLLSYAGVVGENGTLKPRFLKAMPNNQTRKRK
jgi:hypothetical protein